MSTRKPPPYLVPILLASMLAGSGCDDESADPGRDAESGAAGADDGGARDSSRPADAQSELAEAGAGARGDASSAADRDATSDARRDAEPRLPDAAEDLDARTVQNDGAAQRDATGDGAAAADAQIADARVANDAQAGDAQASSDARAAEDAQALNDAQVGTDAALEVDSSAPVCVERGERCDQASCCGGSLCVRNEQTGSAVCSAPCELPTRCDDCGPYCAGTTSTALRCDDAVLLAEDGSYLGEASSLVRFETNSACNENGQYGATFGRYSIYNPNGVYGNTSSLQSAYNTRSPNPPAVACRGAGTLIAYVTKNAISPRRPTVDPDELCAWLQRQGM